MENKDITPIVIDFGEKDLMNESWLKMLGFGIKSILGAMFGGSAIPVTVKGSTSDVRSFAKTLGREKSYMDTYRRYGLDNSQTYKSKYKLDKATKDFTRKTGIKWPFK
jgi:hypothetical protein